MKYKRIKETNITTIYFPTDNGRWTDKIISSFEKVTYDSQIPVNFGRVAWAFGQDEEQLVDKVAKTSPDVVFLPDDLLYTKFAKKIQDKTGAFVIFAAFQTDYDELNEVPARRQAGVYNSQPIDKLIEVSNKMFEIKRIGIVGGPWAGKIIERVEASIPNIKVDATTTDQWSKYSETIKQYAQTHDAVWVLAPFGVLDESQRKWVAEERVQALIDTLPKPVIGWGNVGRLKRTIEMSISPRTLGQNAAYSLINFLKDDHVAIERINSYGIKIYEPHIKKLNATVPKELIGAVMTL